MPIITNIMSIYNSLGGIFLIVFTPLWDTMKKKGITTYTLREKHRISGSTVQRLKKNMSVSTNTLSDLCEILDCDLSDIAEFTRGDKA